MARGRVGGRIKKGSECLKGWPRHQLFTCLKGCALALLLAQLGDTWNCGGQFRCLRINSDISLLLRNHNFKFRRMGSAFSLWEPSRVSIMWFTQHLGMWLLKPMVKVHILREMHLWWTGCPFNTGWEMCRLDTVLVCPDSYFVLLFVFPWKQPHPIF